MTIATIVLNKCAFQLAEPLAKPFASSLKVPNSWKFAKVQPILKPGDPISLLSVLWKPMERLINHSLMCFLRHHELLHHRPYGFQE
jgi:hypothetical protein